jgi:hypothetical protein
MLLVVASVVVLHRIRETHATRWYVAYAALYSAVEDRPGRICSRSVAGTADSEFRQPFGSLDWWVHICFPIE